jgi:putative protease
MELVCPAGNLPSLKAAVDQGADAVYIGFQDDTNARHFAGLNFNRKKAEQAIQYATDRRVKVFVAINTYPQPAGWQRWSASVDMAAELGVDALILADVGLMAYAAKQWPSLRLHLSVQGSATNHEAVRFYAEQFNLRRAVIPRVLSLKQIEHVVENSPVAIEVFGFGSLCVMVEGRCLLSSYVTGQSPNTFGACSPGSAVRWTETEQGKQSRLNGVLIDQYGDGENAGYPTICKGRFNVNNSIGYAIEEPTSLNTLTLLPQLMRMGVAAIKIEGRQRSPVYVGQVTRIWRAAIDACTDSPDSFTTREEWLLGLQKVSEGMQTTFGAYERSWQ